MSGEKKKTAMGGVEGEIHNLRLNSGRRISMCSFGWKKHTHSHACTDTHAHTFMYTHTLLTHTR